MQQSTAKNLLKAAMTLLLLFPAVSNAQLDGILKKAKKEVDNVRGSNSSVVDIGAGLKEALQKGVDRQVVKLTAVDGFYKNEAVRIMMPSELQKVEKGLRAVGLGSLADDGIKSLNRAAEDAVKEATPIFVDAIKKMTIADAKKILMGQNNSATLYLESYTSKPLYDKFLPVVKESIGKVGADKIWNNLISKYNDLPLTQNVNPDLNDYVAQKALEGVFKMIAVEELNIRTDLSARTSPLLKKVFAMQDKK